MIKTMINKPGARAPVRWPWVRSTLFAVIYKCVLSKNIDQSMLKMRIF